jgi:hypothetical protein
VRRSSGAGIDDDNLGAAPSGGHEAWGANAVVAKPDLRPTAGRKLLHALAVLAGVAVGAVTALARLDLWIVAVGPLLVFHAFAVLTRISTGAVAALA